MCVCVCVCVCVRACVGACVVHVFLTHVCCVISIKYDDDDDDDSQWFDGGVFLPALRRVLLNNHADAVKRGTHASDPVNQLPLVSSVCHV